MYAGSNNKRNSLKLKKNNSKSLYLIFSTIALRNTLVETRFGKNSWTQFIPCIEEGRGVNYINYRQKSVTDREGNNERRIGCI